MNIYQIEQGLLEIFDEIEENGGEITPEIEELLSVHQEEFKDKIENYTNVIKSLENDMKSIKEEQARLKTLYDRKEKTSNKLKEIIVNAIEEFGDTKKSGVKYVDYGIGEVSIRKTKAVELNDNLISDIGKYLERIITFNKECNQLDVCDRFDETTSIKEISDMTGYNITDGDLRQTNINLQVNLPIEDLFNGSGYNVVKEIAKYSDLYKLSTNVSKSAVKPLLEENGSCVPNLAKLKENKSLIVK